jgi:ribosomal protein S18 acetylase RimI-like enzyme
MIIRLAQWEDILAMLRIEQANFKERAFSRRQFRHYVQERAAYVLADTYVVYGYIVVFGRSNSNTARINVVSVDPQYIGKGYGSMLLNHVEVYYGTAYDYMALEVNLLNWQAIKLYKSRGYLPKKILADYYGKDTTAIKMVKSLCNNDLKTI